MTGRRRQALGLALLMLGVSGSAYAASGVPEYAGEQPMIREYNSGLAAEAAPLGIVTGTEGNLWFTQGGKTPALDRISTAGAIKIYPLAGKATPRDITLGHEGNLWFTANNGASAEIGKLEPATGTIREYPLAASAANAAGIVTGPEGDLWLALEGGAQAAIDRVVPSSGEVSAVAYPAKNSKPDGITVGPEGDLYFTEGGGSGAIGKLDPATNALVEYRTGLTASSSPAGITTGPEGDIWFTQATNPGQIGRLSPTSGTISEFSGLTIGMPQDIVAGADGNLYFTESNGSGALGRITATGEVSEYSAGLSPSSKPWGITAGPEGNVWFTERANPAKIGVLVLPRGGNAHGEPAVLPASSPASASTPPPGSIKPEIGRTAGIEPLSGRVLVKTPSSGRFVRFPTAATIPIGSLVDLTQGQLRLVTALRHDARQSVTLWGGIVQLGQSRTGSGMTDLRLRGAPLSCPRRGRAHASAAEAAKAKRHTLWARDDHGRYRSYGAYSATTVLGTEWETVDSCAGTLTRVLRGRVQVRVLDSNRTVLVSAGQSYLARP